MPGRQALLVTLAVAAAAAWPMHATGYNQNAHYAFAKALADGVPYIDDTVGEVGELSTGDSATVDGHLYAVKAPGLALATAPVVAAAEALGFRLASNAPRGLWLLTLFGSVLPVAAILLLAAGRAERIEPGTGPALAMLLGLGTLLLPFATLLFAHALGAALAFGAFVVLWREREGPPRLRPLALAGLLAGLGVTTEPQLVYLAAILGVFAAARAAALARPTARRIGAYAAGALLGVTPILAYNAWAFGSVFTTPYDAYWRQQGRDSAGAIRIADGGAGNLENAGEYLFSAMGLLVLTPVVLAGAAGLLLLARRGLRAEAVTLAAIVLAYLVYNTGTGGFGGLGPPRYLVVLVPFLVLPAAATLRALPLATLALGAVSVLQMVAITATGPLASYDGAWLDRIADRVFPLTAASLVGVTGWYAILPFFAAVGVALAVGVRSLGPLRVDAAGAAVAAAALAGWALLALAASNPWGRPPEAGYVLAAAVVAGAAVGGLALLARRSPGRRLTPA